MNQVINGETFRGISCIVIWSYTMTKKQSHMCEALLDMEMDELDSRWVQRIMINDSELDDAEDYKLKELYDNSFGYGMEE